MNKLSLAGLIAGLLLLGALFFGVGFLAAVATYGTSKIETHTSWAAANSADTGKPSAITALAGSVAESFIKDKTADIEAKFGGGALNSLVNKAPAPLRPFAVHAQNKAALAAQQNIGLTTIVSLIMLLVFLTPAIALVVNSTAIPERSSFGQKNRHKAGFFILTIIIYRFLNIAPSAIYQDHY